MHETHLGSQKLTRSALLFDYPWGELGDCTIVDLGCGPGDVGKDVLTNFSNVKKWIFQDLPGVIEMAEKVCHGWTFSGVVSLTRSPEC